MGKSVVIISLAISALLTLQGCNPAASRLTATDVDPLLEVDTIPDVFESPDDVTEITMTPQTATEAKAETKTEEPAVTKKEDVKPEIKPPVKKEEEPSEPAVTKPARIAKVSNFILNAERVMIYEGRRIGTACNNYLRRVLVVSGFADADFMANDFDIYAKKYIKHYKHVDFKNDRSGSEMARLKQHIWSYPERTPFIMQWSWAGAHGHVAIVERINDKLIIYQANMNRYSARRMQTTIQGLLNGFNRRTLTVYSEFSN